MWPEGSSPGTRARHWYISWAKWIQSISPVIFHSDHYIIIFPSTSSFPSCLFSSDFRISNLYALIFATMRARYPANPILFLDLINLIMREVKVMKVPTTRFSSASYCFILLVQMCFSAPCSRTLCHIHTTLRAIHRLKSAGGDGNAVTYAFNVNIFLRNRSPKPLFSALKCNSWYLRWDLAEPVSYRRCIHRTSWHAALACGRPLNCSRFQL
jgi:hypothetical protein